MIRRIQTLDEIVEAVREIGFLAFVDRRWAGLSVADRSPASIWTTNDQRLNPWYWRHRILEAGDICYGMFFARKLGFISIDFFPDFVAVRRGMDDAPALFRRGMISLEALRIYEAVPPGEAMTLSEAGELAELAGSPLDRAARELMDATLWTTAEFVRRRTKSGREYGWPVARYARVEDACGDIDFFRSRPFNPAASRRRILDAARSHALSPLDGTIERRLLFGAMKPHRDLALR